MDAILRNPAQHKEKRGRKRRLLRLPAALLTLAILGGLSALGINEWVKATAEPYLLTPAQAAERGGYDCVLVLGAGVYAGQPSRMLRDRLNTGVALYEAGAAPRLLMTGDHGRGDYDEVNTMKDYAVERGIPSAVIFMDHAGFSTYESMYRARDVFAVKKVLIVTQEYHLYRAVYVARALGLEADGVAADPVAYGGQAMREARELAARVKDVFYCIAKPPPTYLGQVIPISGNGGVTDD